MPLKHGSSREDFEYNVKELISAGHPQEQALAIAYKEKEGHDAAAGTIKAAGIMYVDGTTVLLLKRLDGAWAFPGGKLEKGELPINAACRESVEEVGFKPDMDLLWQIDYSNNGHVQFTTYCARVSFEPILNTDEHSEYRWYEFSELPDIMHPNARKTIDKYTRTHLGYGLDSARQTDVNGWIEIKDNPLSKVGIYPYLGRQISKELDPDKIYMVLRPEEELSRKETVDSFRLVPWIDEHVMLGDPESGMMAPEHKGIEGVTGENIYYDHSRRGLFGNIKVFSNNMEDLIARGKRDLSLGYRCRYEISSGLWEGQKYDAIQRDIRGNHVALVKEGRMGPDVSVLDHMKFTFDAKDCTMAETKEKDGETGLDAAAIGKMVSDAVDAALKAMDEKMEERFKAQDAKYGKDEDDKEKDKEAGDESEKEEEKKAMDAAIKSAMDQALAPIQEAIKGLQASSTKNVLSEVRVRDALAKQLETHSIAVDGVDALTLAELQKAAVTKIGLKCTEGTEGVALDAFFHNRTTGADQIGFVMDSNADDKSKTNAVSDFYSKPATAA